MSFKRLEQACRRDNDSALIGRGTRALIQNQADFTMQCFEYDPVRLFKTAKLLGTLSAPRRDAVVSAFTWGTDENIRLGLEALEQTVMQALQQGFRADGHDPAEKHALQMQSWAEDNRRALRKFLSAHWDGQTDYRQTHPLTLRWLVAHPALRLEVWCIGITHPADSEIFGPVTLTVEQNPLEALKLGTYVGSCLGLGGAFAYSAAAVVLDINKQVVYARTARGTVVGRQLVAISEGNQLVCYEVYPLNAQSDLGQAFAEFDRKFAAALGLAIYSRDQTDSYEIAHILSHDWWDDYAWDLETDTGDEQTNTHPGSVSSISCTDRVAPQITSSDAP